MRAATIVICLATAACGFQLPMTSGDAAPGDDGNSGIDAARDAPIDSVTPEWAFRRTLTINNAGLAAHTSFAVLVVLTPQRINYAAAEPTGADLRFTDTGGNLLSYEIERWEVGGNSIVWVNVPAIAANTTTDFIMLYGNPNAADAQSSAEVWDSSYVGVWHLADARDSAGTLASTNVGATMVGGQIGRALAFNGSNQYVDTASAEHLMRWTIELWLRPATAAVATGASSPVSRFPNYMLLWSCNGSAFCQKVMYDGTAAFTHVAGYTPPVGSWSHVVGRYDGTALESYIGETRVGQELTSDTPISTAVTAKIGTRMDLAGYFNGSIDEVRISRIARSVDYIRAHHRSTTDAYVSYGPEIAN